MLHAPAPRAFRLPSVLALMLGLVLMAGSAQAALDENVINHIPGHYATLILSGADPKAELDEEAIYAQAKAQREKLDVEQLHYLVYNKGKKRGQGARAIGEVWKNNEISVEPLLKLSTPVSQKFMETITAYQCTPQQLYAIYSENEYLADKIFEKTPVISIIEVQQVKKTSLASHTLIFL